MEFFHIIGNKKLRIHKAYELRIKIIKITHQGLQLPFADQFFDKVLCIILCILLFGQRKTLKHE